MRHFREVAAMILAAFVFLVTPAAAEERQQQPVPVATSTCSHGRYLDPVADCRNIPDGLQRDACGHLALQINVTCGFKESTATAQR